MAAARFAPGPISRRRSAVPLVVTSLALCALLAIPAAAGAAAPLGRTAPATPHVDRHLFSATSTVYELASIGDHVLVVNSLANGSQEVVMFDPVTNASRVVEASPPGGSIDFLSGTVAAGGKFFLGWIDLYNGSTTYQTISTAGVVKDLSLRTTVPFTFAYGNATALFATYDSYLVEVDPATVKVVYNYSALLPVGVTVSAVLPVGPLLYVAGGEPASNGTNSPFFGYLNRTTDVFHTVTKASPRFPAGFGGSFLTILDLKGTIYLGGADDYYLLPTVAFGTSVGLFYAYAPASGKLTNLSKLLPQPAWGVYALEPWKGTVALSLSRFTVNATGGGDLLAGGLFSYRAGAHALANLTGLWGPGYLADVFDVTSESGGYLTSGGTNSASGLAEVISVKV